MFSTVVIAATQDRADILRNLALDTGQLLVVRELESYPSGYEVSRFLEPQPDVIVIDLGGGARAFEIATEIHAEHPDTALIACGCQVEQILLAQRAGFSQVLGDPPQVADLKRAVDDAVHSLRGGVEPHLFSFLPAKAGSGASTVVLNVAAALAGPLKKRVLVLEADLRSGILSVMLNLQPRVSLHEILHSTGDLDPFRWDHAAVRAHDVHWLLTNRSFGPRLPAWEHYFQLLSFVRNRYDFILADLPELINPASVEIVRRSRFVFTVCTPEVLSVKMAEHRLAEIRHWGVPDSRIGLLLNRAHANELGAADIGRLLKAPLLKSFPNDYAAIRNAVMKSRPADFDSRVGKAFVSFANQLVGADAAESATFAGKIKNLFGLRTAPTPVAPRS